MDELEKLSDADLQQLAVDLAGQQDAIKVKRRLVRDEQFRRDELARSKKPEPAVVAVASESPEGGANG